jgi:hypothetical protein
MFARARTRKRGGQCQLSEVKMFGSQSATASIPAELCGPRARLRRTLADEVVFRIGIETRFER